MPSLGVVVGLELDFVGLVDFELDFVRLVDVELDFVELVDFELVDDELANDIPANVTDDVDTLVELVSPISLADPAAELIPV